MILKVHTPNPDLHQLEERLGYHFRQSALLHQALTHSSLANELHSQNVLSGKPGEVAPPADNEQLEFLGDSVLGFVTSDILYQRFPSFQEGKLSKLRAHLVSAKYLLRVARQLQLDEFLLLGKGEELSGGRHKSAILTDAMEAILGAIYLDGGIEPSRRFVIEKVLNPELERMALELEAGLPFTDFKSALQEFLQAQGNPQPVYSVIAEEGPAHEKKFTVEVSANGALARAEDSTKKQAAQRAARIVLEQLKEQQEKGGK